MAYDAREVANYILDEADQTGIEITNLKLLKLIFFAHGFHLAQFDQPLIGEEFQAWQYGPVAQSVYYAFKHSGAAPIRSRATAINLENGKHETIQPSLDGDTKSFLKIILQSYANYAAFTLSDLTHQKGTPWEAVWNSFESKARTGMRISNPEIRRFFKERLALEARH